jgi:hypothetical protein
MYSVALHGRLEQGLLDAGLRLSKPQLRNVAMLCVALALSSDCHLGTLALQMPLLARRDSLIQHLRRWLRHAPSWRLAYRPLVSRLLATWPGVEVCLVMDRTDLAHRCSILTLGLAYGHRTLPLAWQVRSFGGTGAADQIALLDQVAPLIPAGMPVTFLGDGEFRAVDLQAYCRAHGWHWQVGLKGDLLIQTSAGDWLPLMDLPVGPRSGPVYCQNVLLTADHAFGPVNILARWSRKDWCGRFWAPDRPADRHAWRRGRRRFWIEPTFRDWKSHGFDLEGSRLTDYPAIETLLLGMAITNLWLVHVGLTVRTTSRRALTDIPHKRDYSLFRLGRDHLRRCQATDWPVPVGFTVHYPVPR